MNMRKPTVDLFWMTPFAALALVGCESEPTVSFASDVRPILDQYCVECHQEGGEGYEASGFSMESYEDLMAGTRNGPMVIPGDSLGSNLIVLMEGRADPSIAMPHGEREKVSRSQIETVKTWVEQGAKDN